MDILSDKCKYKRSHTDKSTIKKNNQNTRTIEKISNYNQYNSVVISDKQTKNMYNIETTLGRSAEKNTKTCLYNIDPLNPTFR